MKTPSPPPGTDAETALPTPPPAAAPTTALPAMAPAGPTPGGGSDRSVEAAPLPARLGVHRVDGVLGRGGMGEVLRGFDERLRRPVALKRMAPGPRDHPDARARFWREARALAALTHPGIVRVHEIGETPEGELFLAMELIEGRTLSTLLDRPWPAEVAAALGLQAADALGAAHAVGLVHRDVKPANLLLQADGVLRVVDFGLARRTDHAEDRVTETGAVLGTPAHMAPEQISGGRVGTPADVFSVGILLYSLIAGVHPFQRESAGATALALASASHVPLREVAPSTPPALAALVERCLERDPEARFPDGRTLAAALSAVLGAAVPGSTGGASAGATATLAAFLARSPEPKAALAPASNAPPAAPSADAPAGGSLPAATPGTPAAIAPRPTPAPAAVASPWRTTRWLLAGLAVSTAAFILTRPDAPAPPDARSSGAEAAAAMPRPKGGPAIADPLPAALPPRPVVAVLGFEAPGDEPDDPRALVLADALRTALDAAPEQLVSVPLAVLDASLPPAEVPGPQTPLARLRRSHRGSGNIDFAVSGRVVDDPNGGGDAGALSVEVRVVDTLTGRPLRVFSVRGTDDVIALAWQVAPALADVFGSELPAGVEPPTRSVNAWGALLLARKALRAGEFEAHERNLTWALRLDPGFSLARLERLALLRAKRDLPVLAAESKALAADLEGSAQLDHLKALATAWAALGSGDAVGGLRGLHRVRDGYPEDVDALHLLLALRTHDAALRDFAEVERLARELLALAPRSEEAASRLVRALSWRGRVAEADAALAALDLPPDDPAFLEVFAEQDLYAGRFDAARRKFRTVLERSPDDLYAEHMGFAAQLLGGDCPGAAIGALDRLHRIESEGRDANLDWTYSLAVQSLLCAERWVQARGLFDRWAEHSESGREQVMLLRPRLELAAGGSPERVARQIRTLLGQKSLPSSARMELMGLFSRVGRDVEVLNGLARDAETAALAPEATPQQRASAQRAGRRLALRALVVQGRAAEALLGYAALALPFADVKGEGDLGVLVEAMFEHAEALAAVGRRDEAQALRRRIVNLGYPRLWVEDVWVAARRALGRDGGGADPAQRGGGAAGSDQRERRPIPRWHQPPKGFSPKGGGADPAQRGGGAVP